MYTIFFILSTSLFSTVKQENKKAATQSAMLRAAVLCSFGEYGIADRGRSERGVDPVAFVGAAVEFDDFVLRVLARACQGAGVLECILGHEFEILRLNAEFLECARDADLAAQAADGVDALVCGFVRAEAVDDLAHRLGDVAEAVEIADEVEFADVRQQDGVADAVRQVVETAELMGHGMDVAEGGVVEGDAGEILAIGHLVTGVEIIAVGDGFRQVFLDHVDGLQGCGVGQRVGGRRYVSFDGMRQCVHARGSREARRHALHERRIVDGDLRRDAPVEDGHLDFAARVRDDAETRDLGSRAGCRVDSHERHHLVL